MPSPPPDPELEDLQARRWLREAAGGDRAAFERLYRQVHPRLLRFLGRYTGRHDVLEDVINDAMMVVWRKAGEFRGESRVSTWIMGIAYRCMLKTLRSGAPADELGEAALGDLALDDLPSADDAAAGHELRDWLNQGLKTLPEEQRTTLVLAYAVGESCESIASIMGCAVGTVKARLFHARVRLRNILPALGGDTPRAGHGDPL